MSPALTRATAKSRSFSSKRTSLARMLRIVAELVVELGELAEVDIYVVCLRAVRISEESRVHFHGPGGLCWERVFRVAAQDGLAADDEDVALPGNPRHGAQDMRELLACHRGWPACQ